MSKDDNPTANEPADLTAKTEAMTSVEENPEPVIQNDASAPTQPSEDPTAELDEADEGDVDLAEIKAQAEKLGVPLEQLLALPMTHDDVLYLLELCPYLQVVNTAPDAAMREVPAKLTAQSGWTILDYGNAMTSSPGMLLFADNKPDPDFLYGAAAADDQAENPEARGTIVKQAVDTAAEMVFLAMQKKWPGITVLEGHERMKWAAWVMANDHEYPMQGYQPTDADVAKQERLRRSRAEIDDIFMRNRQTMAAGSST